MFTSDARKPQKPEARSGRTNPATCGRDRNIVFNAQMMTT